MTATLTLCDKATTRVRAAAVALFNEGDKPSFYVVDDAGEITLKPSRSRPMRATTSSSAAAWQRARKWSRSACRSSTRAEGSRGVVAVVFNSL